MIFRNRRSFLRFAASTAGTMRGVRNFGNPQVAVLPGGRSVWYQPDNGSYVLPFRPNVPELLVPDPTAYKPEGDRS